MLRNAMTIIEHIKNLKDKFERLSNRFVKHIRWLNSIRNTSSEEMIKQGCPELLDWYNEYSIKYDNLNQEQLEAL